MAVLRGKVGHFPHDADAGKLEFGAKAAEALELPVLTLTVAVGRLLSK
jgi:hypothetical protein